MITLTIHQVAEQLNMSERWLRDWLAANPMDVEGKLFYTPIGRRKEFDPSAADRIRNKLREIEECRLSYTVVKEARSGTTGEQLVRRVKENAAAVRHTLQIKSQRRVRLPGSKAQSGTVITLAKSPS